MKNARSLFEKKQYSAAFDMYTELVKTEENKKEVWFWVSKSFLFSSQAPMNDKRQELFLDSFSAACKAAETIDEMLTLEHDMLETLNEWKRKTIKEKLKGIKKNPTLEDCNKYIAIFPGFVWLELFIQVRARDCQVVNDYIENNGLEKGEFGNKFPSIAVTNSVTDDEICSTELQAAKDIFLTEQNRLATFDDVSADSASSVCERILRGLFVARSLSTIHSCKESNSDIHCSQLKLKAEITSFLLDAKISVNGAQVSILLDGRLKDYNILQETYTEIQIIDPSFNLPPLPSVIPEKPAVLPNASNSNSEGCYVATAVYGSYDCPEVWTLRRFRDNTLAKSLFGRLFISLYYAVSPMLVKWFGKTEWFKNMWKPILDEKVKALNLNGVENTPYEDRQW